MTEDEFDVFYASAFPRVVGQVYALTGDHGQAQDAVQEAFVRAWDRRREFSAVQAPEAWIRTVAMRLAVSHWRRARRWLELVRRTPPPEHAPGPGPEHLALVEALRRIPDAQRLAIVLHHLCDLSVEQVASETGAPTGTVKARLARGRAALAQHLATNEDDVLGVAPVRDGGKNPARGAGTERPRGSSAVPLRDGSDDRVRSGKEGGHVR
ncbi:SigE family RNA polymerase sigma factor [Streptomyces aureocirculatus]|uniref:SigE family RNA polymerase sigma factor n=1 Tax=Streptomyces aureocirculatus TaxID=67275 RepID=UPI00099B7076